MLKKTHKHDQNRAQKDRLARRANMRRVAKPASRRNARDEICSALSNWALGVQ